MLDKVPIELLLKIRDYVADELWYTHKNRAYYGDLQSLISLSSTCRFVRRLSEPKIYEYCIKSENRHELSSTSPRLPPNTRLRKYLRTILERPELASLVTKAVLNCWEADHCSRFDIDSTPPGIDLAELYKRAASKHPLHTQQMDWISSLERGFEDAEVALLLASLPHLESLEITLPNPFDLLNKRSSFDFLCHAVFEAALRRDSRATQNTVHGFQNLNRIKLTHHNHPIHQYGFPLSIVSQLFCLPSLKSFEALGVQEHGNTVPGWDCPPRSSNVTKIYLDNSAISAAAVEPLANSCKKLESFTLSFPSYQTILRNLKVSWKGIREALQCQCENLQSLNFDCGYTGPTTEDYEQEPDHEDVLMWQVDGTFDTFKDFCALKSFQGNSYMFAGNPGDPDIDLFDAWPQGSLEHLSITDSEELLVGSLEEMLAHRGERWPMLRTIKTGMIEIEDIDEADKKLLGERIARLKAGFAAVGVEWHEEGFEYLGQSGLEGNSSI